MPGCSPGSCRWRHQPEQRPRWHLRIACGSEPHCARSDSSARFRSLTSRTTCTRFSRQPASSITGAVDATSHLFNDGSKNSASSLRQVSFDFSSGQPVSGRGAVKDLVALLPDHLFPGLAQHLAERTVHFDDRVIGSMHDRPSVMVLKVVDQSRAAAARASSACLRSLMSSTTSMNPRGLPSSSNRGEALNAHRERRAVLSRSSPLRHSRNTAGHGFESLTIRADRVQPPKLVKALLAD